MAAASIELLARRGEVNDSVDIASAYLKLTREAVVEPTVTTTIAQLWTNAGNSAHSLLENKHLQFTHTKSAL